MKLANVLDTLIPVQKFHTTTSSLCVWSSSGLGAHHVASGGQSAHQFKRQLYNATSDSKLETRVCVLRHENPPE